MHKSKRLGVAAAILAAVATLSATAVSAQQQLSASSEPQPGEKVLSFHANMARHAISITHGGIVGMGTFPPGIPPLSEPALRNGLILDLKFADADGNVVGFGSELEYFPDGHSPAVEQDVRWQTGWAVVVPGRGMIFLEQIEHSGGLGPNVIQKTRETGKDWVGDWWITTTVGPLENGRGRIVGGTGEFADIRGEFVEIDHLTRFTVDGRMELDLELRLFIK